MGRVYRARHLALGRTCAVKVILYPQHEPGSEAPIAADAAARFKIEAFAASRLDHPNILRVLDFGREVSDGLWYLVTEHLEGEDLEDVIDAERVLAPERIVGLMMQACSALQHAHDRGVVHRDLKPQNLRVVLREDEGGRMCETIKIVDFGAARIDGGDADEEPPSGTRVILGTPAYMAPEQASGCKVDGRADIYACGVMLFEMATGRLPFECSSPGELADAHIERTPPAPRSFVPDLDPALESIILWCLRKDPGERPQSARELREALAALRSAPRSRGEERTTGPLSQRVVPSLSIPPPVSSVAPGRKERTGRSYRVRVKRRSAAPSMRRTRGVRAAAALGLVLFSAALGMFAAARSHDDLGEPRSTVTEPFTVVRAKPTLAPVPAAAVEFVPGGEDVAGAPALSPEPPSPGPKGVAAITTAPRHASKPSDAAGGLTGAAPMREPGRDQDDGLAVRRDERGTAGRTGTAQEPGSATAPVASQPGRKED
jgi:serine/threonine protein kinase